MHHEVVNRYLREIDLFNFLSEFHQEEKNALYSFFNSDYYLGYICVEKEGKVSVMFDLDYPGEDSHIEYIRWVLTKYARGFESSWINLETFRKFIMDATLFSKGTYQVILYKERSDSRMECLK